jgi:hypothetical protein
MKGAYTIVSPRFCKSIIAFVFVFFLASFLVYSTANAQNQLPQSGNRGGSATTNPGQVPGQNTDKAGGKDLLSADVQTGVKQLNRLKTTDLSVVIGRVVKAIVGVIGSIAIVMFVAGGIMWMTARGNAEKTQKSIKILVWSALGSIVILASYTIVDFIFKAIEK